MTDAITSYYYCCYCLPLLILPRNPNTKTITTSSHLHVTVSTHVRSGKATGNSQGKPHQLQAKGDHDQEEAGQGEGGVVGGGEEGEEKNLRHPPVKYRQV